MAAPPSPTPTKPIDRQTTPPFLLKLYYRSNTFHRLDEFTPGQPGPPHLQIYTWPTCTLRELTHLLASALPSLLPSPAIGTRLSYRLVYPDTRASAQQGIGRYLAKELGSVVIGAGGPGVSDPNTTTTNDNSGGNNEADGADKALGSAGAAQAASILDRLEGDAERTLQSARFVIGDYISCAVFPPLPNGDVASAPAPAAAVSTGPPARGPGGGGWRSGGQPPPPRENGYGGGGGYGGGRPRGGGMRAFGDGGLGRGGVPPGEWRRGDVPPPGAVGGGGGGGYGRGRGRGRW